MAKASINFKAVKASSEMHNERLQELDYIEPEFSAMNESWKTHSIAEMDKEIKRYCKATSGRKMQKNATPIREAVVNLNHHHSVDDLRKLSDKLEEQYGMKAFQIHVHRDEGIWENGIFKHNYHAHIVFRWQDMASGKTLRLNKLAMSQIQTLVSEELRMERGEYKENSNVVRLEAVEYKAQQEEKRVKRLQEQNQVLEQKKMKSEQELQDLKKKEEQLLQMKPKEAQKVPLNESSTFLQRILRKKKKPSLNSMKIALIEQLKSLNAKLNILKLRFEMKQELQQIKAKTQEVRKNKGNTNKRVGNPNKNKGFGM